MDVSEKKLTNFKICLQNIEKNLIKLVQKKIYSLNQITRIDVKIFYGRQIARENFCRTPIHPLQPHVFHNCKKSTSRWKHSYNLQ